MKDFRNELYIKNRSGLHKPKSSVQNLEVRIASNDSMDKQIGSTIKPVYLYVNDCL